MDATRSLSGLPVICYVTYADNSVVQVEVEQRAKGQDVLDKICRMLGILEEAEYFGIQFIGGKNELLWVNNRNRLSRQIPAQPPYHLYFKVKYFVPPDDILLESTRLQFYNNVVHQIKGGVWDSETTLSTQAHLIALMAYVQFGKYNPNTTPCKYACFWPDSRGEIPADAVRIAATYHRNLENHTVPQAQWELLRTVHNDVPCYGTYFYEVKDIFERRFFLGVGPENVFVCTPNFSISDRFPYCRVHTVTTSSRVVTLNLLEDDGSVKGRNYQLSSPRLATALYRSITEVYAFFRCESVRKEVLLQTRRDIRDAISFHHNYKEYAFDVRYTFREVYDRARRRLYHSTSSIQGISPGTASGIPGTSLAGSAPAATSGIHGQKAAGDSARRDELSRSESITGDEEICELVQQYLTEISLCRVCMDAPISRVFVPCGHVICCAECADRIEECSICRRPIEVRHHCFLPWNTDLPVEEHILLAGRRLRKQSDRLDTDSTAEDLPRTASAPPFQLFPSTLLEPSPADLAEESSNTPQNLPAPSIAEPDQPAAPDHSSPRVHSSASVYSSSSCSDQQESSHEVQPSFSMAPSQNPRTSQTVNLSDTNRESRDTTRRQTHVSWQLSNEE